MNNQKKLTQTTKNSSNKTLLTAIKGFLYMLSGEMLEEVFEQLIEEGLAGGIAWIFSNAITNTIFIFVIVQGSKVTVKQVTKILIIFIKPFIKKLIYKEGNDKVEALKKIMHKAQNEVATNPKALTGLVANTATDTGVGLLVYILTLMADMPEGWRITLAVLIALTLCVFMSYLIIKYVHEAPLDKVDREAAKQLKAQAAEDERLTREAKAEQKKLDAEATALAEEQAHKAKVKARMEELQKEKEQEAVQ